MLYNIISYKDPKEGMLMAANIAAHGVSDFLFNNGVRVVEHALTREQVKEYMQFYGTSYKQCDYEHLFELVTSNSDFQAEPGRAWKGRYENRWDNKLDPKYPIS